MPERCPEKNGIVVGCRSISATPDQLYLCERNGEIESCKDCMRCPMCGGLMLASSVLVMEESPASEWHFKTCPLCSHYMKGEVVPLVEPETPVLKDEHCCQVEGCHRRAFEHYRVTVGEQDWSLCAFHKTQIYHWGYFHKGLDRYPIKVEGGRLVVNPHYKRQGRRPK